MKNFFLFLICFLSLYPEAFSEDIKNIEEKSPVIIYQKVISPIDGDRCTMYPSCSEYSKEAFRKYGFFKGFIMTCDRLLRCGGDEKKFSKLIEIKGKKYIYDPVENN